MVKCFLYIFFLIENFFCVLAVMTEEIVPDEIISTNQTLDVKEKNKGTIV